MYLHIATLYSSALEIIRENADLAMIGHPGGDPDSFAGPEPQVCDSTVCTVQLCDAHLICEKSTITVEQV
jgi:hypothetical protein